MPAQISALLGRHVDKGGSALRHFRAYRGAPFLPARWLMNPSSSLVVALTFLTGPSRGAGNSALGCLLVAEWRKAALPAFGAQAEEPRGYGGAAELGLKTRPRRWLRVSSYVIQPRATCSVPMSG